MVQGVGVVGGRKVLGAHAGKASLNLQHRESEVHDGAHIQDVVPCFVLHHLSKREAISMIANKKDNTILLVITFKTWFHVLFITTCRKREVIFMIANKRDNTILLLIINRILLNMIPLCCCDHGSTTKNTCWALSKGQQ